jgi:hypothetical protein
MTPSHEGHIAVSGPVAPDEAARQEAPTVGARMSTARFAWWKAGVPIGLVALATIVARLPSFGRQLFDSDEATVATMGMVVSRGGVLYRDVIDRKPPLAAMLYAATFWVTDTRSLIPVHVLAALGLAAAALIVASDVRRRASVTAGWWAAALLIAGAVAFRPAAGQAANYSQLALLPGCAAIVLSRRGTARGAAYAGLALGIATLTRQTWLIGLGPAALGVWLHGGRQRAHVALLVATTALTIVAVALFAPFSAFWHWTFSGNGSLLFAVGHSQHVVTRGWRTLRLFLIGHVALCWLALRRGWHFADLDLWAWLAAGLVTVVVGFRFFDHYWFQVLPPLVLLAAPAIDRHSVLTRGLVAVAVLAPTLWFWTQAWSPNDFTDNWTPLVTEIRQQTHAGDRITVWGAIPELYWRSGRAPGGGLVLTDFLVGRSAGFADGPERLRHATPGARAAWLRSMYAHPPKLFLDTSVAGIRSYGHYPLKLLPPVSTFVARYYRRIATVSRVNIYELVHRPTPVPPGRHATSSAGPPPFVHSRNSPGIWR